MGAAGGGTPTPQLHAHAGAVTPPGTAARGPRRHAGVGMARGHHCAHGPVHGGMHVWWCVFVCVCVCAQRELSVSRLCHADGHICHAGGLWGGFMVLWDSAELMCACLGCTPEWDARV